MTENLNGKKVAFLSTDGFEDSELTSPWEAVTKAGAEATLVALESGQIEGKKGTTLDVDQVVADADPTQFDALVLPGGTLNSDKLRVDADAQKFTKHFMDNSLPVGVICHGAWILTEIDAVRGRQMTSVNNIKTDLVNAGANWVDEEVVCDKGFVSSRTPDDLPAFNDKLVEEIAEGQH